MKKEYFIKINKINGCLGKYPLLIVSENKFRYNHLLNANVVEVDFEQ